MPWTPPRRLFTTADAYAAGAEPHDLRGAVAARWVVAVRRGIYLAADRYDALDERGRHLVDAAALVRLMGPGAVLSHASAALLHGIPVADGPRVPPEPVVTCPHPGRSRLTGARVHRAGLPDGHVVAVRGVPATSPLRTAVDLARGSDLPGALVGLDAALRAEVLAAAPRPGTPDHRRVRDPGAQALARARLDAVAVAAAAAGWPGAARAAAGARAADPRSESPLESLSRGRFALAGLPPAEPQVEVEGDDGVVRRVDLRWPGTPVVGEADGLGKYAGPEDLRAEKRRQVALEGAGFVVVRWTWAEIRHTPDRVAARVAAALERSRATGSRRVPRAG